MLTLLAVALAMSMEDRPPCLSLLCEQVRRIEARGVVEIDGQRICARQSLVLFYTRRNFEPAWSSDDRPLPYAGALLGAIDAAAADGLDPADYHRDALQRRLKSGSVTVETELLLTDAFLGLASDLLDGRVEPRTVVRTWCLEPRKGDVAELLESALAAGDVEATLQTIAPEHGGYRRLRDALARYRAIASAGGWAPLPARPSVRALTRRLVITGDLAAETDRYDQSVADGVRRFQLRHGLDGDGIAGTTTRRELNVPVNDRIRQIELNLERWRWMPESLGPRAAMINIPSFELVIFDGDRVSFRERVVVGKAYQSTPVFSSEIREIVFSPYWNVPESIAEKEIWPRVRRDARYLASQHMEVTGGRIRQRPGPWNALGVVKFVFDNNYGVYIHDTPARSLFARSSRAFSHGCMRVQNAMGLAARLLSDQPAWTAARMNAAAHGGREVHVPLRQPMPLHVLYFTAWVDRDGVLQFRPDVYARDAQLQDALSRD